MPRVKIYRNSANFGEARLLNVDGGYVTFLQLAGKKLNMKTPRTAYTKAGVELNESNLGILEDDEEVFISEGEPFWKTEGKPGVYKIALLGVGGVGKSCITLKYIKGCFTEVYDPSIEDAFRHQVVCDDIPCILEILDTAGQEEYRCIAQQWVKKKHGFMLAYSLIDNVSFANLQAFYNLIADEYESVQEHPEGMPPIVLVGNKLDLDKHREVSAASGQALAEKWNAKFFETSAKTSENIEKSFQALIRMMRARDKRQPDPRNKKKSATSSLCFLL